MTRWEALTTICSYLRAGLLGGEREANRNPSWELIVEVASFHQVTPALASCCNVNDEVPGDIHDYFESVLALNAQRNELMFSGLARVAGLLNAIDIEPVLLKGAAHVVEGVYPAPSMRILGDVDVLIPVTRSAEAFAALEAAGFRTKSSDVVPPPNHHHLPMLHDPETGLGLELHTDVISRSAAAVISTDWFCQMVRPTLFRGQRVRLPEPTRNVGHTIFHSEIFHELYSRNKIELRHLLDMALIRARHGDAVDWDELDHRFSAAGFGELLATYLHFADELLSQPAPKLSHAPRSDAMAKLQDSESRDSFHFQIEVLQAKCDNLQTQLSLTLADRDHIKSEVEPLNSKDETREAPFLARVAKLKEDITLIDTLQEALNSTQRLGIERANIIDSLQAALDATQKLATERANKIDTLQAALDAAQKLATGRANKIDTLQAALDAAQKLATGRANTIGTLQEALDVAQKLATERANTIDTLQEALDVTQKLATERGTKIDTLQEALDVAQKLAVRADKIDALQKAFTGTEELPNVCK